jgi:hypothetical protein
MCREGILLNGIASMHEKLYNQDILVEEILGMSLKSINWS